MDITDPLLGEVQGLRANLPVPPWSHLLPLHSRMLLQLDLLLLMLPDLVWAVAFPPEIKNEVLSIINCVP